MNAKIIYVTRMILLGYAVFLIGCGSGGREYTYNYKIDSVLDWEDASGYIRKFNEDDNSLYTQYIPNSRAEEFLRDNIPYFDCPDKELEKTYYFRWWIYRKHIKETPDGFVITEFLPEVPQGGKYNTISCPAAHHFYEGRWLRDQVYLHDYANFWFKGGGNPRSYSFWPANSILAYAKVWQNEELVVDLLPHLIENFKEWEKSNSCEDGLFWQVDLRDGMEASIGGSGKRPTINSYMIGEAMAIGEIARIAGDKVIEEAYTEKTSRLKDLLLNNLWDPEAEFFKTMPLNEQEFDKIDVADRYVKTFSVFHEDSVKLVDVRELHGYTPWYFNIPEERHAVAWKFLTDTDGFKAPFGPTTAERSHPGFIISYESNPYICQWNGPSWPYSTSITIKAMANLLRNHNQATVSPYDFVELIETYSNSHRHINEKGEEVFWIDENLNPFTGQWLARVISKAKRGIHYGEDYNHSEFCDIIISDLVGIQPSMENEIIIEPLIPNDYWDWFCLDRVNYHDNMISVVWDKDGSKYQLGGGFSIYVNGELKYNSKTIQKVVIPIE